MNVSKAPVKYSFTTEMLLLPPQLIIKIVLHTMVNVNSIRIIVSEGHMIKNVLK